MERQNKRQLELLLYKLFYEILILWSLAVFGFLIIQSILPNYFFSQISLAKAIFVFFGIIYLIGFLAKRNDISFSTVEKNGKIWKTIIIALLTFSALIIINSFKNLGVFLLIGISSLALVILFFFYQITLKNNKS
jgi:hypothetical protein